MVKKIGILTSGGDSQGMNSAICSVVKTAQRLGIETYFIYDGYKGMHDNKIEKADINKAILCSNYGGTFIGSSRLPEFKNVEIREAAIQNLKKHGIEAVVVIGGDGSYMGAKKLTEMGINCIGIPGTIDNDIACSKFTLGFDSCLNIIVESIDRIRDTSNSHNRCALIETMGRNYGDLPLYAGIAAGVDLIVTPEKKMSEEEIIEVVRKAKENNQRSFIILTLENMFDCTSLAARISKETKFETRATVLGHIQRGGRPFFLDRFIGNLFGARAVELLAENKGGRCLGFHFNEIIDYDILHALEMPKKNNENLYKSFKQLIK